MQYVKLLPIGIVLLFISVVTSAQATNRCSVSTPMPALTWRHPTLEEIHDYLCSQPASLEANSHFRELSQRIEITSMDVDGDSESDLIVSDYLYVGVLLWITEQNEYHLAYEISSDGLRNSYS